MENVTAIIDDWNLNKTANLDYAENTCTYPLYLTYAEPYSNGWTYRHIILLAAGISSILTIILSFVLTIMHLINWVKPAEQKQIVRIVIFAPIFALFNFFSVYYYKYSWILERFPELYECFALVAMFYLLVIYVAPDEGGRESFFHRLDLIDRSTQTSKHNGGNLKWFRVIWALVFQILPTRLILCLLQWIVNARMCPLKYEHSKISTLLSALQSIVTALCVVSIIRFYNRMKNELRGHHALAKLVTFKGIVGIQILQSPIFTGLAEHGVFKRTDYISELDFSVGTPAFMTCCEMLIISAIFMWSFSARPYGKRNVQERRLGIGRAIVDVLNIGDILRGCFYMVQIILGAGSGPGGQGAIIKEDEVEYPMPVYGNIEHNPRIGKVPVY